MTLQQLAFDGRTRPDVLEEIAIDRLLYYLPYAPRGYFILGYSGGKDSGAAMEVAKRSGVPFVPVYNPTGLDSPELIQHIRKHHPEVVFAPVPKPIGYLIKKAGFPPLRNRRYCCRLLKEQGNRGMAVVTGVRFAESASRTINGGTVILQHRDKKQRAHTYDPEQGAHLMKICPIGGKLLINPICDWSDNDVWAYTRFRHIPYCSLYDEGFVRLGCIGCPCGNREQRLEQFRRWPNFERAYVQIFDDMLLWHPDHRPNWKTGRHVFDWWLSEESEEADFDDGSLFEEVAQ